jgi:hypothetical protein
MLAELSGGEAERVLGILTACPIIDVEAGVPYFSASFEQAALLLVEEGFVVLRAMLPGRSRSIITYEGGPGRLVLPPSAEEVLFGLRASRLVAIRGEMLDRLLELPGVAQILLGQLAAALAQM